MDYEVTLQKLLAVLDTQEGRDDNNKSYMIVKSGTFENLTKYLVFTSVEGTYYNTFFGRDYLIKFSFLHLDPSSVEAFLLTYRGFGYSPADVLAVVTQQYSSR